MIYPPKEGNSGRRDSLLFAFSLSSNFKQTLWLKPYKQNAGEHGTDLVQKEYMDIMFSEQELDLQKNIKKVFYPKGILNSSKVW